MIVTLTLNPALDLSTSVQRIQPWRKMRCAEPTLDPGGGGINVARAVNELGGESLAVAALGGHVGALLADSLHRHGIALRRVRVAGETRQNYAVTELSSGEQFRFVHPGPPMTGAEWNRCLAAVLKAAVGASCVVASSSLPTGVPDNAFAVLADRLERLGVALIVDTSGPALAAVMTEEVDLVKPSVNELSSIVQRPLTTVVDYESAARDVLGAGRCKTIAVSLGAEGALFVPRDGAALLVCAPDVPVVSTSGAGDSMVAALAIALARGDPLVEAARFSVAAGTAAVLAHGTGLCRRDDVDRLLPLVAVIAQ